jgi:hypothetical protein
MTFPTTGGLASHHAAYGNSGTRLHPEQDIFSTKAADASGQGTAS